MPIEPRASLALVLVFAACRPEPRVDQPDASAAHSGGETDTAPFLEESGATDTSDGSERSEGVSDARAVTTMPEPPHWVRITMEWNGICGQSSSGKWACWGHDYAGYLQVPDEEFSIVELADVFTCAVRPDASIACWGLKGEDFAELDFGQTDPPAGAYSGIAAASMQACAIGPGGELTCWGKERPALGLYTPEGTFAQVSAKTWNACGLHLDGRVSCWIYGQSFPEFEGFDYVAVSAGDIHALALRQDGTVACRGGISPEVCGTMPQGVHFQSVSAGSDASCGILEDGSLTCWAASGYHGLFLSVAEEVPKGGTWLQVEVGMGVACGLRDDHEIECWGMRTVLGLDEVPSPPE